MWDVKTGVIFMNWDLLIPLLVTVIVSLSGWVVVHRLEQSRDRSRRKQELRITSLIEAYRRIDAATDREMGSKEAELI